MHPDPKTQAQSPLLWRLDHRSQEVIQCLLGIFGEAGVDGARLHDGAPGRHEPPEPLDGGQEADGPCPGTAGADAGRGFEVGPHVLRVEARVERA